MKNFYQDGKNIAVVESVLAHPSHTDGLVDSGDPVVINSLHGVATHSAAADTDTVIITTEGVYTVAVKGHDGAVDAAVGVGEKVYIDAAADALINKDATKTLYGIALKAVALGATTTIPVKLVH